MNTETRPQHGLNRKTAHANYFINTWQKFNTHQKLDRVDPHKFFDGCLYWLIDACTANAADITMIARNLTWLGNGLLEDATQPGLTRTQQYALQTVGHMLTNTTTSSPTTLIVPWAAQPNWRPKTIAFLVTHLTHHVRRLFQIHDNNRPPITTNIDTLILETVTLDREKARTYHRA